MYAASRLVQRTGLKRSCTVVSPRIRQRVSTCEGSTVHERAVTGLADTHSHALLENASGTPHRPIAGERALERKEKQNKFRRCVFAPDLAQLMQTRISPFLASVVSSQVL